MNDRPPSGNSTPPASAPADHTPYGAYDQQGAPYGGYSGYGDGYSTGSFDTTGSYATAGHDTGSFATDPLFGDMPGSPYDTGQWSATGTQQTLNYDPYAAQHQATYDTSGYETGSYDTHTAWSTGGYQHLSADIPAQAGPDTTMGVPPDGVWGRDTTAWNQPQQTGQWEAQAFDTGTYDATAWNSGGTGGHDTAYGIPEAHPTHATYEAYSAPETLDAYGTPVAHEAYESPDTPGTPDTYEAPETYEHSPYDTGSYAAEPHPPEPYAQPATAEHEFTPDEAPADALGPVEPSHRGNAGEDEPPVVDRTHSSSSHGSRSRSRRRSPAKRSALFTIAVPSACVMGVAGIAAASVGDFGGDEKEAQAASAPDPTSVQPSAANNKLDTQLANVSADAGDFADRASRTQERIDLKAEKVAAEKKAAEEAARKERLRPKFALPVKQQGLSAYYGQAGINWMSAHSGIDFPVSYGTEVLAATDGTVSTKWNSAYGNMAIVTAKDGTETWYCHLSTHTVSSGPVKAGDPIAFSGNSGNSTGPHLHFEVRPGGGSAIDPLPWLRSHNLDPT